ncbi:Putative RNA binding protein HABP4/SERBP1 [Septoria linicola]|uniref:RNA binding protein HABP4/SERBP1 n=1 Tax=Septoria linicola TaxID=215465 RepID=A0A9Q9ALA9_9PEZI|nr:Putative RNA binding protein HABP4/SERBP1 [Septoria linicola]
MDQSIWAQQGVPQADAAAAAPATKAHPAAPVDAQDMFAQTGAQQDELFDDVVPAQESMRLRSDDDLFSDDFTPASQPVVEPTAPEAPAAPAETGRGRGGGNRRGSGRGHRDVREQTAHKAQPQQQPPENAPTGPRKETVSRKDAGQSVRGDRQATGGLRKPKLTEQELAEKMARIQIKNASLTAAHARAEADAASFAEREQQAKSMAEQRRKEERRDRQQMLGEREKNRLRKLRAQGGREWDAEKPEQDFDKGARHDKPGGFAGDRDDYNHGREYLYREPRTGQRGQGRGGGRGGGGIAKGAAQSVPTQDEFPALPSDSKGNATSSSSAKTDSILASADAGKEADKSWADQVESSANQQT